MSTTNTVRKTQIIINIYFIKMINFNVVRFKCNPCTGGRIQINCNYSKDKNLIFFFIFQGEKPLQYLRIAFISCYNGKP